MSWSKSRSRKSDWQEPRPCNDGLISGHISCHRPLISTFLAITYGLNAQSRSQCNDCDLLQQLRRCIIEPLASSYSDQGFNTSSLASWCLITVSVSGVIWDRCNSHFPRLAFGQSIMMDGWHGVPRVQDQRLLPSSDISYAPHGQPLKSYFLTAPLVVRMRACSNKANFFSLTFFSFL